LKNVAVSTPEYHPINVNTSESQVCPCMTISSKNKSFVVFVGHRPDDRSAFLKELSTGEKSIEEKATEEESTEEDKKNAVLVAAKSNVLQDCTGITATELRDAWYADLQRLTQGSDQGTAGFVAPVWQTDKSSSGCQLCSRGFTLTRRRHHCRICGKLVCNSCSPHRLVIASIDKKKKVRVCNACVDEGKGK
jgi:hypothetical protein